MYNMITTMLGTIRSWSWLVKMQDQDQDLDFTITARLKV